MGTEKNILFPDAPVLEEGTYQEDVNKSIEDAERITAQQIAKAKRDRDLAIMGDLAGLVAQAGAMHGGAWEIGKLDSATDKGNQRLRDLREKYNAQAAQFARQRANLREENRREKNKLALEDYKSKVNAYKTQEELKERNRSNLAMEEIRRNQLGDKTPKTLSSKKIVVNGKTYSELEHGPSYLMRAYVENGEPEITRRVQRKNAVGGYEYNPDGTPIFIDVPVSDPTDAEIEMALLRGGKSNGVMPGVKVEDNNKMPGVK